MARVRWTPEEDKVLLDLVDEYESSGRTRQEAEQDYVKLIGGQRTFFAVRTRVTVLRNAQKEGAKYQYTMEDVQHEVGNIMEYIQTLHETIADLKEENERLQSMQVDYEAVTRILMHARNQALEIPESRTSFRMDQNGNLERMSG